MTTLQAKVDIIKVDVVGHLMLVIFVQTGEFDMQKGGPDLVVAAEVQAAAARVRCRSRGCGCTDLNLVQTRSASISHVESVPVIIGITLLLQAALRRGLGGDKLFRKCCNLPQLRGRRNSCAGDLFYRDAHIFLKQASQMSE